MENTLNGTLFRKTRQTNTLKPLISCTKFAGTGKYVVPKNKHSWEMIWDSIAATTRADPGT